MTAQLQERPKPPSEVRPGVPPQLNGIILHSMAKDPAERFQSADEFSQALESVRRSIPASAGAVAAAPSFPPAAIPFSPTVVASTPTAATSAFNPVAATTSPAMAPPIPPVAPQPVPSVMQLSPAPHKGRGLYMALGAIIVVAVLVLAGLSLPRWLKTRAAEQQQKSSVESATPDNSSQNSAQTPSSTANPPAPDNNAANPQSGSAPPPDDSGANSAPSNGSAPPVDTSAPAPDSSPSAKGKSGRKAKSIGAGDQASTASSGGASSGQDQPLSDAGSGAESIEAVEQDVDETSSRVAATTRSLDTMRRQFQSQGLGLRGDIVSAQELMNANLERAHQALQNRDAKNARRYLTIAQAQEDKIEKFLGH
jgi:serine/threonine-protein kinase